jgi:hypothetical protein
MLARHAASSPSLTTPVHVAMTCRAALAVAIVLLAAVCCEADDLHGSVPLASAAVDCDASITFYPTIHDLFRPYDQQNMLFMFDLWKYEDVKANADAIYTSVSTKSMPLDVAGKWTASQLSTFQTWQNCGMPEGTPAAGSAAPKPTQSAVKQTTPLDYTTCEHVVIGAGWYVVVHVLVDQY